MPQKKYSKSRPHMPVPIRRTALLNAGYACILDLEKVSLVPHHIDGNRENNSDDNIAILCSNCHMRVHRGEFSAKDLREAKKKRSSDILTKLAQSLQYFQESDEIIISSEFNKLRQKYQTTLSDYGDKLIFYQCFIYLIPGFYIDDRGQKTREIVRDFLAMDSGEEQLVLTHLQKLGIIEVTGGLVSLKDNTDAKTATTELLEKGKINLSELLMKFGEF